MTYQEINATIESMGVESTYYSWPEKEAPALPYILFYYPERNDFQADGKNYAKIVQLNIELYTRDKDFETESTVEDVLDSYELTYTKEEQYIESEKMYEVLYIMEVMLNE